MLIDSLFFRSGQQNSPCGHCLRALCFPAQNQHWAAQRRRFLLQTAGVRHHKGRSCHEIMHLIRGQGLDQMNPGMAGEILLGHFLNHRREMDGIDQFGLWKILRDPTQRLHNMLHRFSIVLSAVTGDPLPCQVFPIGLGRAEMELGQVTDQGPVHLLREGRITVPGP